MLSVFHSIKGRLIFFSLCISLIPIAVITTIYYFNARRVMARHELDEMASIVESKKRHVLCFLEARKGRVIDFSSDGFIKDSLETITRGGVGKDEAVIALSRHLSKNKMPLDHYIVAIAIVDKDGKVIASNTETIIGVDVSGREPFLEATKKSPHRASISQPCYDPYLDANCMFISAPIISRNSNEPIGVIVNAYNPAMLNEITFDCTGKCETLEIYLVNRDKIMLTRSRFMDGAPFKQMVDTEPVRKIAEEGKEMVGIYRDYRDVPVIGASAYLPEYGWTLLAEMDEAEAFGRLKTLGTVALITGLISIAAAAGVGIAFAASASRPIRKLTDATKRFAEGDLSCRVGIARKDEIGSLAGSFNRMADKLSKEINGHVQAKKKLVERENYLKTIIDSEPDCVKLIAADGAILKMNAAGMAMVEVDSPDQIIGRSVYSLIIPEYHEAYKALTERVFRGESGMLKFEILGDKGTRRWLETHAVPLRNVRDEIIAELSITRDITERRKMENELRKRDVQYTAMLNTVPDGFWIIDTQGRLLDVNIAYCRMIGYNRDELLGMSVSDVEAKETHEETARHIRHVVETGSDLFETRHRRKDGSIVEVEISVGYYPIDGGRFFSFIRDTTYRKIIEENLLKLSCAVEQSASTIVITNDKGNIEYANPKFVETTGYTLEEAKGQNPRILKSGKTPPEVYERLWSAITSGREWKGEFCNKKKTGELYYESASIAPIKNTKGVITHFVAVKEDITLQKHNEEELRLTVEEKKKSIEDLRHLMEFSNLMREEIVEGALIKHAAKVLKERFSPDFLAMLMLNQEENSVEIPVTDPVMDWNEVISKEVVLYPTLCRVLRTGHNVVVRDVDTDACCDCLLLKMKEGSSACFPISAGGITVGAVMMVKNERGYWDSGEKQRLISAYIGLAAASLDNIRLMNQAKHSAITDALTGIYNRRFFVESLEKQLSLANRYKETLVVILADVDHFKRFNDTYGHTAGDRVLQQVSKMLGASIRDSDVLCRYGGEEFAIIMPRTNAAEGYEKAEKIRLHIESARFTNISPGNTLGITISMGIASFPEHGVEYNVLVDAADGALYKAKKNGSNRVEAS